MQKQLLDCIRDDFEDDVVIAEPYIPYVPSDWNRLLVLAESQNLSAGSQDYVDALRKLDSTGRMTRLGRRELAGDGYVGVAPWDDGPLKLAVEAGFGAAAERTAVSNAVLWSRRHTETQANVNPDGRLKKRSSRLWRRMLEVLAPEKVIVSGNVAYDVTREAGWHDERTARLRLPSRTAMSRISGMFDENDLLRRYPEVYRVASEHPEWIETYRRNGIFFACHAVSLYSPR